MMTNNSNYMLQIYNLLTLKAWDFKQIWAKYKKQNLNYIVGEIITLEFIC